MHIFKTWSNILRALNHRKRHNNQPFKTKEYRILSNPKKLRWCKTIQSLLNNYRRFIRNFVETAKFLNNLLKQNQPFIWSDYIPQSLLIPKIQINQPNKFDRSFILTTDAPDFALNACLSQEEIGFDIPISYASKSFKSEKYLLATHSCINFFKSYTYGTKLMVVTTHRKIISLFIHKSPSLQMTQIRIRKYKRICPLWNKT